MQFLTLAALFGAAIAAPVAQTPECPNPAHCPSTPLPDPASYENVDISNYTISTVDGKVQSVSFLLSGKNATNLACEAGPIDKIPSTVINCGDSKYRFVLTKSDSDVSGFGQTIYHELGPAFGVWNEGVVPTVCYGVEAGDITCNQKGFYTTVLHQ